MKVSTHGKKRIRERLNPSLSNRNINSLFKTAIKNGYTPRMFVNGEFKDYLMDHSKHNEVKVFQNMMFLYSGGSRILYTAWKVPEKYLPVEQFLKRNQPNPNQMSQ